MWMYGGGNRPFHLNPFHQDPPVCLPMMYECLFGFNTLTQVYEPCIGTDITWNSARTNITINLNPNAEWSDGNPITPDDVCYSYELGMWAAKLKDDFRKRYISFNVT